MIPSRVRFLILSILVIVAFFLGTLVAKQTTKPPEVQAQPSTDVPAECGQELADYMNTIIGGAGNLPGIRLTSPVFNLTNPREYQIFLSMSSAGADWAGLAAFAGNTYHISGNSPYFYYATNPDADWKTAFAGVPVIFTEFGNSDQQSGPGNQNVSLMANEFNQATSDGSVYAAIYFNAFNSSTGWSGFALSPAEFNQIISSSPAQGGANSAQVVRGYQATWPRVMRGQYPINGVTYNTSAGWAVEILYSRNDLGAARAAVETAFENGNNLNLVLRLCDAVSPCGFENPQDVVAFLGDLSPSVPAGKNVWVVAGPNEPANEGWAAPSCLGEVEPEEINPFEIAYVPCNLTYESQGKNEGREFHSLRPYPASPCDPQYYQDIQTLMCGQDLIAKQVYEVTPEDATGFDGLAACEPAADGFTLCRYEFSSSVNVQLDLTNAELPIAGNTEDVPNAESANTRGLTFPQRVNEYVSWYLNGTTGRAEEEDEIIRTSPPYFPSQVTSPRNVVKRISEVINFSGPIKKLLPLVIQNGEFYILPTGGALIPSTIAVPVPDQPGLRGGQRNLANISRHDQIAVCEVFKALSYLAFPVQCYRGEEFSKERITEIDPFVAIPGILTQVIDTYNPLFSFIPFSSTEDLIGRAFTEPRPASLQPGGGLAEDPYSSTAELIPNAQGQIVTFIPGGTVDITNRTYHSLYFAHMQENTELAEYLQRTYLPSGKTGLTDVEDTLSQLMDESPFCNILEARTNPGDSLHGDFDGGSGGVSPPEPDQPGGTITYTTRFSCLFDPPLSIRDPDAFSQCVAFCEQTGEPDCATVCDAEEQTCQKNVLVAMNVQASTPKATDLWSRLVMGTESIFRKMMPKIGPGGPFEEIEDEPAYSNVSYSASGGGDERIIDTEALAGDPYLSTPGSQAKLYFPHLGAIHEYFLIQIQEALRPYNLGGPPPIDISPDCKPLGSPDELNALLPPVNPECASTNCSSSIGLELPPTMLRIIESAASAYKVPASVLLGILYNEGGLNPSGTGGLGSALTDEVVLAAAGANCEVANCEDPGGSYSGARGPWQFLSSAWSANKNAANLAGIDDGRVPNVCNIVDLTFAAARLLGRGSAGYQYSYSQCLGVTLNNGTQGISTSCNWNPSRVVTAAKQYYGLCMDPNNDAAIQEAIDNNVPSKGATAQDVRNHWARFNCTQGNTAPCYQNSVLFWFNQCQ